MTEQKSFEFDSRNENEDTPITNSIAYQGCWVDIDHARGFERKINHLKSLLQEAAKEKQEMRTHILELENDLENSI